MKNKGPNRGPNAQIEKAKDLVYEFKNKCVENGIRFINALIKEKSLSTLIK